LKNTKLPSTPRFKEDERPTHIRGMRPEGPGVGQDPETGCRRRQARHDENPGKG
jgi:hypothetical protein